MPIRKNDARYIHNIAIQKPVTNGYVAAYDTALGEIKWSPNGGGGDPTLTGDVTGLGSANTVEKIRGKNVPAPVVGDDQKVLTYNHGTLAYIWTTPTVASVTMGGDVTGNSATSTVEKLRGRNVPLPGAPEDLLFLRYNHGTTAFVYAAAPAQTPTMAGDVTGTTAASVVEKIRGKNVPLPGVAQDEMILKYDHDTSACVWIAQPAAGATNLDGLSDVTITAPQDGQTLRHNGAGQFVNVALGIDDLAEVAVSAPTDGQVLTYDGVTLLKWINETPTGAAPAVTTTEVNLGSVPKRAGRFTIAGAGMTVGKAVMIQQASGPYTGKGTRTDEAEMDQVNVSAKVISATVIEAFWHASGPVAQNMKFNHWTSS